MKDIEKNIVIGFVKETEVVKRSVIRSDKSFVDAIGARKLENIRHYKQINATE